MQLRERSSFRSPFHGGASKVEPGWQVECAWQDSELGGVRAQWGKHAAGTAAVQGG